MSPDLALILVWLGFLVVGSAAALGVFVWGIRSGQFGDQERARSLPLDAGLPADGGREGEDA